MFWMILFLIMLLLAVGSVVFLLTRTRRFLLVQRIAQRSRLLSWLVTLLPLAAVGCFFAINAFTVIVVMLILFFVWLLCDLTARIIRKCAKKQRRGYPEGVCAMLLTAALLGAGWFFAHHVYETDYRIETQKALPNGHLRIAMLADSHIGVTLSGADFAEQLARIRAAEPDMLLIAGDYVDDDTPKQDMLDATAALGDLDIPVYLVLGNHDKGYYQSRSFSAEDLREVLAEHHVTLLEDETAEYAAGVCIIGRQDRSVQDRAAISALTPACGADSYQIVLDHQPNDYAAEAAAGADLVLSGHTHGGHIFPAGQIGLLIGANDRAYGTETRGNTTFLVTSGISGWAIPFKIGALSEYVIIDVYGRNDSAEAR